MTDYPAGRRASDLGPRLRLAALSAVMIGVVLLAAAAFVLSYWGIHQIAMAAGVTPGLASLYPVIFDAMLVIASAAVLALRGAGWPARSYVWLCLIVLVVAVATGDAVHAMGVTLPRQASRAAIAVTPWVLVLLAFGLLLAMLRHRRLVRARGRVTAQAQAVGAVAADGASGRRNDRALAGQDGVAEPRVGLDALLEPRPGRPPRLAAGGSAPLATTAPAPAQEPPTEQPRTEPATEKPLTEQPPALQPTGKGSTEEAPSGDARTATATTGTTPGETGAAESTPAETSGGGAAPAPTTDAGPAPAVTKPAVRALAGTASPATTPAATTSAEAPPAATAPAATTPAATTSAEAPPAATASAETPPVATASADTSTARTTAVESAGAEATPADPAVPALTGAGPDVPLAPQEYPPSQDHVGQGGQQTEEYLGTEEYGGSDDYPETDEYHDAATASSGETAAVVEWAGQSHPRNGLGGGPEAVPSGSQGTLVAADAEGKAGAGARNGADAARGTEPAARHASPPGAGQESQPAAGPADEADQITGTSPVGEADSQHAAAPAAPFPAPVPQFNRLRSTPTRPED